MSNFWSSFLGRDKEERGNQNAWAQQVISHYGNVPINWTPQRVGNVEHAPTTGEGYATYGLMGNPIIFALCATRMMIFAQARFLYQNLSDDGRPEDYEWGPSLRILEKPWPNGQSTDLMCRMIQDVDLHGNFYAVTEGVRSKGTHRLRRLNPEWVDIILSADPRQAAASDVEGYRYRPGGSHDKDKWVYYPVDGSNGKVAHWAPYPDPLAMYRGMTWMTPIVRDIMADTAAAKHKGKFFENAATPNLVISYPVEMEGDEVQEFIELLKPKHGVNGAYETMYLGGGADVTVVGSKMDQMAFKEVIGHGETRMAAAAGIHPVVAGFSEAMQGASLNAGNFGQAKRNTVDKTMVFLWVTAANALSVLVPEKPRKRLWYDDRDVPFTREDQEAIANILNIESSALLKMVRDGWTPESVVTSMMKSGAKGSWDELVHTGLLSVQLQPPGETGGATIEDPEGDGAAAPASGKTTTGKTTPAAPAATKPSPKGSTPKGGNSG